MKIRNMFAAWISAIALLVGGLAFAPAASAHATCGSHTHTTTKYVYLPAASNGDFCMSEYHTRSFDLVALRWGPWIYRYKVATPR